MAAAVLAAAYATQGADFNVRDFGARGDRTANDAGAIQRAVDACAAAGGGVVRVPTGQYLCGTVRLAGRVDLRLDPGAVLCASTRREDYPPGHRHLLEADGATEVTVSGGGILDGQAGGDLGRRWGAPETADFRTGILLFEHCTNAIVRDIAVLRSDSWTLHFKRCEGVTVEGVTISNNYRRLNSDGIDPNSCRHVRIRRCRITAGDDAIVLKTTAPFPCEDVEVSDCTLESATAALKIGTESQGDFRRIVFRDCVITNSPVGVGLYLKDGATMEDITASNLVLRMCGPAFHDVAPLYADIERRNPNSKIGRIRNLSFRNIAIETGTGLLFQGMPESPIENLSLAGIRVTVETADDYAKRKKPVGGRRTTRDERDTCFARLPAYAAFAHIRGLTVDGFEVRIAGGAFRDFPRCAAALRNVEGGTLRHVRREPGAEAGASPGVVDVQGCRDLKVE